jgi:hypothetical protein
MTIEAGFSGSLVTSSPENNMAAKNNAGQLLEQGESQAS